MLFNVRVAWLTNKCIRDHCILLERLSSCFGISSAAIFWIKFYLLNSSYILCLKYLNSFQFLKYPSLVLFSSYTIHSSIWVFIASNSAANHHIYICWCHTQLLLLLRTLDFSHYVTQLENTIQLYITYIQVDIPTSSLLIHLKLSFSSLVYHNNSLLYSIFLYHSSAK